MVRHTRHKQAQPLRGRLGARHNVHDAPFVNDGDTVGEGQNLVQVLGDQQNRRTAPAFLDQPLVNVLRRADVQAARRLRRDDRARRAG